MPRKKAPAIEAKAEPKKKRAYKKRAPAVVEPEGFDVLSLRLPTSMKADFQAKCQKDHRTMSQQVAFLVDSYTNPEARA